MGAKELVCGLIFFGVVFTFAGFVMTIYGNTHKPFFEGHSSSCGFCADSVSTDRRNIRNTKIAGPICLILGITLIIIGIIYRKKSLKEHVQMGIYARADDGTQVLGYSSTGISQAGIPQTYHQPGYPSQIPQGAYPPQPGYPPPQGNIYPPQNTNYPPPHKQITLHHKQITLHHK